MYNRYSLKIALIFCLVLSFGPIVTAQVINKEEVTVVAPYNPSISKAHKIFNFPTNEENMVTKFKLDYYTNPKLISTTFDLEALTAARYISPKDRKYEQNVIRAGMGLYTTPYAELFLNGNVYKNLTLGIHARHLSSKATVKGFSYGDFSNNGVELWGKNTSTNYVFLTSGFYQRDAFHYYGFVPNFLKAIPSLNYKEITSQVFSDAGMKFNLSSTEKKDKESFKINGAYRYFWDMFNNRENLISLNGVYLRPIDLIGLKNQNVGIGLNTEVAVTDWKAQTQWVKTVPVDPVLNIPQQFFHGKVDLQLFYKIQYDRFEIKAGGIFSAGLDSSKTIKVYPDFLLNVNVVKNILDIYVLFDGDLISPSYYSTTRENPFVTAFLPLNYSSISYRLKGGLRANVVGKADIHLWGSREKLQNAVFFSSDMNGFFENQFKLIYDDVERLQIGGDINMAIGNASVNLQMIYQEYTMTNEAHAWYKPKWTGQITANYWLWDNLKLNLDLNGQSKVWAKVGQELHEINDWYDLSLGANYYFNKKFSAFVNLNNVLAQNYQLWYNYPVKGFQAMAGISYAF